MNTPFIIVLYKGSRGGPSNGTLSITIDDMNIRIPISTNNRMFVIYADSNGLVSSGAMSVTNSFNATSYMNGKQWISGSEMTVKVASGSVKDLTFDIVLKAT